MFENSKPDLMEDDDAMRWLALAVTSKQTGSWRFRAVSRLGDCIMTAISVPVTATVRFFRFHSLRGCLTQQMCSFV
jgi:hypothetical protein